MNPADIFPAGQAPEQPKSYVDVTEATFQAEVLDRSHEVPVVVDLWAAWCGPCRQLGPVLERLAAEAAGSWVLAKVDVDANPRISQAFGVRGIPAVKAIVGGKLVSEFTGALPEREVRAWLETLPKPDAPGPGDEQARRGMAAEQAGDLDAADAAYRAALAEAPAHAAATVGTARVSLARRLSVLDEAALAAADPADVATVTALADVDMARGEPERAFDRLLAVVRSGEGPDRDRARSHLLGLLALLPGDDPLALSTRRSLAAALF